ncbi:carboxymuconolactone decarboxylase protein (plasmid) [Rhizobium etli]|uniref:Carboxymuconolactone decarboxylase protein n=1 Tax=Rhizobium etli TaxID=29449 RepID=A0AAN1BMQ5_RHIET|nr:carboxymuconolactone decarboxylase family protein [Rhizobium etli]ARQ13306.1 carboxymuconolactone decarboxylase protein [Rhizobium etli]
MNNASGKTSPCPPISDDSWPAEIGNMKTSFAGALNVYRTMAHHPALLKAWAGLRQHVVKESALGPVRSELVILRAAHRMGSAYEWAHHVSRARVLGISDSRIRAMRGKPEGEDGLVARAVDALFDDKCLPADIANEAMAILGKEAVFDLMATVGFYSVLGFILITFETPIDEDVAEELKAEPL